jgi:hypothetical protein
MGRTWGEILREDAEKAGLPHVSLWKAQEAMKKAGRSMKAPAKLAHLMLNHGRLTPEARAWLSAEYPQG